MKNTIKILLFLSLFFLAASLLIFPAINKHYDNENGMRNVVINRLVIEAERTVGEGEPYAPDLTELQGTYGDRYTPDRVEYLDAGSLVDTGEDYVRDAFVFTEAPSAARADCTFISFFHTCFMLLRWTANINVNHISKYQCTFTADVVKYQVYLYG